VISTGGIPGTYTQVMSGQIDVGWSAAPYLLDAADQGKIRIIANGNDVPSMRDQTVRVNVTHFAVLESRKPVVERFSAGYRKTVQWVYQSPDAAKAYAAFAGVSEALVKRLREEFFRGCQHMVGQDQRDRFADGARGAVQVHSGTAVQGADRRAGTDSVAGNIRGGAVARVYSGCSLHMQRNEFTMQRYIWSRLNKQQVGAYTEYFVKMELTMYGFQVYSTEVDDRGIDFVARHGRGPFIEVQVKSLRASGYVFMHKSKFSLKEHLYLALGLLSEGKPPELFLIPSFVWETPNVAFVSRDYGERLKSKPEWGLNISPRNRPVLEPYRFENSVGQLMQQASQP
jgi:hypothetical protein